MNNGMLDFKPFRSSGYTGNRHDDAPASFTLGQMTMFSISSFICGMAFALTLSLLWGNV